MNKLFYILLFFLMITQITMAQWMTSDSEQKIQQLISQTNLDSLTFYLRVLTGEDSVTIDSNRYLIKSRHILSSGNNLAADFIYQTLTRIGLPAFNDYYNSPRKTGNTLVTGRNVYAVQTGIEFPDQEIIICAHYDDMPPGSIAPGADDNASGVAAVLEAARVISHIETKYTIIYAFWDEEELGLIGSRHYADQAFSSGDKILGVINLDMIAWESNNDNAFNLYSSSVEKSLDLARLSSAIANYISPDFLPIILPLPVSNSDHASFWEKDFSAVGFEEEYNDFNPYYHTGNDNLNHFNFDYFFNMSKISIGTLTFLDNNGLEQGNLNSPISSLDRNYVKLGVDSVLFRIAFPEYNSNSNFIAHLLYSNVYGPVIDSVALFDDGLHGDSLSGDGIFGAYIPPQSTEDFFIPTVSTIDQNTNKYHCITQWIPFTTVGPVSVGSTSFTKQGTSNNYKVTITLKNESANKTIEYTQLKLKCLDSWVNNVSPEIKELGNILHDEKKTIDFSITSSDSLPHLELNTEIEILSYGYTYWKYSKQIITGIDEELYKPLSFNLDQNYPNPFNPTTTIKYSIPKQSYITIKVYDILGREIETLVNEEKPAGSYEINWNASKLSSGVSAKGGYASGVYFYQLKAGEYIQTKKMILLK
jgi:hypothetical protein